MAAGAKSALSATRCDWNVCGSLLAIRQQSVSSVSVSSGTSLTADFVLASGAALGDRNVTGTGPRDLQKAGMSFVPGDRHRFGLILTFLAAQVGLEIGA